MISTDKLPEITSRSNQHLRQIRLLHQRKQRRAQQLYLIEGVRLAEEALAASVPLAFGLVTPAFCQQQRGAALTDACLAAGVPLHLLAAELLGQVAATEHNPGVLLVAHWQKNGLPQQSLTHLLVADGMRDPGNLGGLFRTAAAAGCQGMLLTPDCVDVYNPKVVRAAMGALFRLPFYVAASWEEAAALAQEQERRIFVAAAGGEMEHTQADLTQPLALVIGSEAVGPDPRWRERGGQVISLPMAPPTESLNAGVAAGVLLYEILRQRRGTRDLL